MDSISLNTFKESLKKVIEKITHQHTPIKVTDHLGQDFVVISAEDWEREQETLYVLQNRSLIKQIADSMATHKYLCRNIYRLGDRMRVVSATFLCN